MNHHYFIANAILWSAAIIAAAILQAPAALTAILLPSLATCALIVIRPKTESRGDETKGSPSR